MIVGFQYFMVLFLRENSSNFFQIWDGVSNKCIATFPQAHNGAEVGSDLVQ